ncbi:sulfatase-like hydrolase/transferase [Hyalangium versicolor]|uniref:sulfatase-like hydrolase/transferase n=1 Tax=Hyalangium versicolor TaxID=2861190 RepID=UPI001CCD96E8|nr:sulfatase-like hydrolase/transferase [Hyalangium versicolor]
MNGFWGPFKQQPNVLILLTDQQRTAQYLPKDWVKTNLPNLWALMRGGVQFPNAMTSTTACSPSRATLWTGTFPMINGVDSVGATLNMKAHPNLTTLGLALASYAPKGITYDIAFKGKWHLNKSFESGQTLAQQQEDADRAKQLSDNNAMQSTYGFPGWTSQDFGTAMAMELGGWKSGPVTIPEATINTMGAGYGGNDARVATGTSYVTKTESNPNGTVDSAKDWLAARAGKSDPSNPFCLIVSLLNPHDIFASPAGYTSAGYLPIASGPNKGKLPWQVAPFTDITTLPDSYDLSADQLANKPSMQGNYRWTAAQGASEEAERRAAALDYLRFYAYLETLSDALLGEVISALTGDMAANTLIIRLADHGEMGMSQGGMIEKEHQAYNETLLVPMVFSNPGLPQAAVCTGLAGLIDVLPTLVEICQLSVPEGILLQGTSVAPAIMAGASGSTYHQLQFATNDSGVEIRALIDDNKYNAKYVASYNGSSWQCELYDFSYDPSQNTPWPSEIINQIPVNGLQDGGYASSQATQATWSAMHAALTSAMQATNTTPPGWPATPPSVIPS